MMDLISTFFLSSRIADLVLAVMLVEAVVLLAWSLRTASTLRTANIMSALLPGFFLVLALRAALVQAEWFWIALALVGALITHLVDMRMRFQSHAASSLNR
jgi:hypothetical protein